MNGAAITPDELTIWSRYIQEICGIYLDKTKGYLLETRLKNLLHETSARNFHDLYAKAKSDLTNALRRRIIEAITTNETSFFRDTSPFELLRHKIVPELIDRRRKAGGKVVPLRIWSAACSTGQEAYSTAIMLRELLGGQDAYDIRIIGTDISDKAVAKASYGQFSRLELSRGLPPDRIAKYFTGNGEVWKVRDEVRALTTFRTMNLLQPFSFPAPFDVIFCRNVAIYFTEADKARLFRNVGKCLAPDGALIIGSTESLTGVCPDFEPQRYHNCVFYRLRRAG